MFTGCCNARRLMISQKVHGTKFSNRPKFRRSAKGHTSRREGQRRLASLTPHLRRSAFDSAVLQPSVQSSYVLDEDKTIEKKILYDRRKFIIFLSVSSAVKWLGLSPDGRKVVRLRVCEDVLPVSVGVLCRFSRFLPHPKTCSKLSESST